MKIVPIALLGTLLLVASSVRAQATRLSPHETISSVISGNRIMIVYGRPYTKNPRTGEVRKIWGGLVPFDKIWRTGADEATIFTTEVPINIGGVTVPAGAYSLWTIPTADGGKLVLNKQVGQWGVDEPQFKWRKVYDQANDVARADMKKSDLAEPVDQFTMSIENDPDAQGGGVIKLKWEKAVYSVGFTFAK